MSGDADKVRVLVEFKRKLETKIQGLNTELKELQATLETVNSLLLEKGFKRAELGQKPLATETMMPEESEKTIEPEQVHVHVETEHEGVGTLKSVDGEVLANLFVDGDSLHVVPAEDKSFNINTPPFNQFLVQRVLLKMQERDSELVRSGQLTPDRTLCFDIVREGDMIREIVIRNIDSDRLRELRSSVRWTLEKMLEKAKG